jgi:hypothetical protein
MIKYPKALKMQSLDQQILQLQLQMSTEQQAQQQRQQQLRQRLADKLSSWPVVVVGLAAGLLVHQLVTTPSIPKLTPDQTPPPHAILPSGSDPSSTPVQMTGVTSIWNRLLSLPLPTHPLLTQSVWWCAEHLWHWGLVQARVRQNLSQSQQRHHPYS